MKIEIVIPTVAGREKYLRWAIKSCLSSSADVEVLISNNGSGAEVRQVVKSFDSNRIRLVETKQYMPMALHWEFACSHVIGDVISIIGDDDAVVPKALQRVIKTFDKYRAIESITHKPAHYYWPDYPQANFANKYFVPVCSGNLEIVKTADVLRSVIEMRDWYGRLPYLYHGFVKRDVLLRIKAVEGLLFKRIAPDIYLDFVLASYLKEFIRVDECWTVGGQGAKSNGANLLLNTELGKAFLCDLPEILEPRFTGKSINLQIYEYSRIFARRLDVAEEFNSVWFLFVAKTLMEAAKNPAYKVDILADLGKVLQLEMTGCAQHCYRALISVGSSKFGSQLITFIDTWRQGKSIRRWSDARAMNATNVYEIAELIGARST